MPINIGLTFLFGGILGWIVVKILKPERHLEGLVIATCSAGDVTSLSSIFQPILFILSKYFCSRFGAS